MRAMLTISLPDRVNRELSAVVKRTGKSRSQVVQEALRRQLAIERFRRLRRKLMSKRRNAGFYSDEDALKAVS